MNEMHSLQVLADKKSDLEGVDSAFLVEGLLRARKKTREVLDVICGELKEGIDETEARKLALTIFADYGAERHWHQPFIRFGAGSVRSFHAPLSQSRLGQNDIYHLDVGPVWTSAQLGLNGSLEYEGDYGNSFVYGKNSEAQKMIQYLHQAFEETCLEWSQKNTTGEALYANLKLRVQDNGYKLVEDVRGHRIGDFPHHKYSRENLSKIAFTPSSALWVLEIMILHPTLEMGAFYEDLIM